MTSLGHGVSSLAAGFYFGGWKEKIDLEDRRIYFLHPTSMQEVAFMLGLQNSGTVFLTPSPVRCGGGGLSEGRSRVNCVT